MLEDEENQISGIVAVGYENGKSPLERFDIAEDAMFDMHAADGGFDKALARGILRIPLSVPIRPMGYHVCADSSPQWQSIFDTVMIVDMQIAIDRQIQFESTVGSDLIKHVVKKANARLNG